jgi:hypothetical protein
MNLKGMIVYIYKSDDCSKNGICSGCSDVLLVGEGVSKIFEVRNDRTTLKLITNELNPQLICCEPIEEAGDGMKWVSGGRFISSSDSRFPSDYPIPVHDILQSVNESQSDIIIEPSKEGLGLLVNVLRNDTGDFTNNGISSRYDKLLLIGDGIPRIHEANGYPIISLAKKNFSWMKYIYCKPVSDKNDGDYVMGGNFVWSNVKAFPFHHPIALHDRLYDYL